MAASLTAWPRRTARLRLTALYGGLFLLFGGVLAVITYVLFERATTYRTPPIPKVPHTPAIGNLKLPSPLAGSCRKQLAPGPAAAGPGPASAGRTARGLARAGPLATQDQQLTQISSS